jgi:hypothetical protein
VCGREGGVSVVGQCTSRDQVNKFVAVGCRFRWGVATSMGVALVVMRVSGVNMGRQSFQASKEPTKQNGVVITVTWVPSKTMTGRREEVDRLGDEDREREAEREKGK